MGDLPCPGIDNDHTATLVSPRFAKPSCLRSLLRRRPSLSSQLVHAALARLGQLRNPRFAAPCYPPVTQNQVRTWDPTLTLKSQQTKQTLEPNLARRWRYVRGEVARRRDIEQ